MDTTDQAANGRSFGKGLGLKKSLMTLAASVMLATSAQAAVPATAEVNTTGLAVTDDTVTVGILHSITGTMAISIQIKPRTPRLASSGRSTAI